MGAAEKRSELCLSICYNETTYELFRPVRPKGMSETLFGPGRQSPGKAGRICRRGAARRDIGGRSVIAMASTICFCFSVTILAAGICMAVGLYKGSYKRGRILSPIRCMWGSVFLSGVILMLPIYSQRFSGGALHILRTLLMSVYSTMRQFILDGDLDTVLEYSEGLSQGLSAGYSLVGVILHVLAPILTFGFVLSFFRNISSYRELLFHYRAPLYVFSELNEKSLVLAESIKQKDARSFLVFTDVFENREEPIFELCEKVRELKGVCFRRDIVDINWKMHRNTKPVSLFVIGEDEAENIDQAIKLKERYREDENFQLYIFASSMESEILFNTAECGGMRIRRCNPIRSLINEMLYQDGHIYFDQAIERENGDRLISVVLLGMGQYGMEMLKALTWFCQMDGYEVEIHAFDKNPDARDILEKQCPELMAPDKNGVYVEGDAYYTIAVYPGIDVTTIQFADALKKISAISHVFIALGSDGENTGAALDARMLCSRNNQHPVIQTIVHSHLKSKAMEKISDYRGHPYDIHFIGDLQTTYSEQVVIHSQLERAALERHLKWEKAREHEFWAYESNYRSSVAAAIHLKMRKHCRIPGADKREEALTEAEKLSIGALEHRRWNAYMRSEGYIFSGSKDEGSRNDLAKMHHDLVPYVGLTDKEKPKDVRIGTN